MEEIEISHLTKIEGHAKLSVGFDRNKKKVKKCSLEVFESPRYFEAAIKNRSYKEVPYLAGRICGICNIAHLVGSAMAVENALEIKPSEQTRLLRELLVLSGIFHSHVLHIHLLALPDYLGCSSALDMKGKGLEYVKRGLRLKEIGNDVASAIGGRSIHPITSVVGGFTKIPEKDKVRGLVRKLREAKMYAKETAELIENLEKEKITFETEFLSLETAGKNYPFLEGNVVSLSGRGFVPRDYRKHLEEKVVPESTSKHVTFRDKSFMVGPLARVNVHREGLSEDARNALKKLSNPEYNLLSANAARAAETIHCIDRCLDILEMLELRKEKVIEARPREGEGISATEAPRGLLYHHYKLNKEGNVTRVNIIPPTTQNVKNMEDAVASVLPEMMNLPRDRIRAGMEKLIRAYDPCMSCSAHFLELEIH